MGKQVITEADVLEAAEAGSKVIVAPMGECIITHGARDKALSLGLEIDESPGQGNTALGVTQGVEENQAEKVVDQVTSLIRDRIPGKLAPEKLEDLVRKVVTDHLTKSSPPREHDSDQALTRVGEVCFIRGNRIPGELSGPIPVEEKVMVSDAFRCSADASLAGGYMEWSKASFHRVVDKEEICIVIDGELSLTIDGRVSRMKQGDMVYLPRGTTVLYSTPDRVKLACVNSLNSE